MPKEVLIYYTGGALPLQTTLAGDSIPCSPVWNFNRLSKRGGPGEIISPGGVWGEAPNNPFNQWYPNISPWVCIACTGSFADSSGTMQHITDTDLAALQAGYNPAYQEAPLVFGHPKDNGPAFGWVHALKKEGSKLFANFAQIPETVRDLVAQGRYRYVSMAISPDKKRLLHVGLLGGQAPAIDGLGPVCLSADGLTINFAAPDMPEYSKPRLRIGNGARKEKTPHGGCSVKR